MTEAKVMHITPDLLQKKVQIAREGLNQMASSAEQMSQVLGMMSGKALLDQIEHSLRFDNWDAFGGEQPKVKLDIATVAYLVQVFKATVQTALGSIQIIDVITGDEPGPMDGPPPGTVTN